MRLMIYGVEVMIYHVLIHAVGMVHTFQQPHKDMHDPNCQVDVYNLQLQMVLLQDLVCIFSEWLLESFFFRIIFIGAFDFVCKKVMVFLKL